MLGSKIYAGLIILFLVAVGMLLYPTVYGIVSAIDVTGWLPISKAAMVIFSYFFVFFMLYLVWNVFKGKGE